MKIHTIAAVTLLLSNINSFADSAPVAIIEEIQAQNSSLSFMDYVNEGHVIKLGSKGKLIIGYLNSCRRETITGGTVTVGSLQSNVIKGQLLREDVECDGGNANLTGQVAATSGALAFRGAPKSKIGIRNPDLTIYGTSPVIRLKKSNANITIERTDQHEKQYTYQLKGKHIDLASKNISLSLGGVYRIVVKGGKSKTFKVDKYAEKGAIPIVSRLIDL